MQVGSVLVHPSHGPAKVIGMQVRTFRGVDQKLVELEVIDGGMTMLMPVESLSDLGMREPMGHSAAQAVLEILRAKPTEAVKGQWARQFKAATEQARSGDPLEQAAVVRDLLAKDNRSAGEARLLTRTKAMLGSELAGPLDLDVDAAQQLIEDVVAGVAGA